ncbi:MAG: methylenetetrahydrofolate reductase [Candidatus Thermoplasmatota archaeon]|nr:methylenetetrahydrofolate reductase [Candidatus Thermoplasmatota archaeon]MBU1941338.1 methylenetetrahydrofolate reductase [Candidatus Thermoplasmatota archaeon]
MPSESHFARVLSSGQFAVTAEVGPPKHANPATIHRKADNLKGFADAFNVTDNQTAVVRLSSFAGCVLLQQHKMDPIMQMTCRDRNRIALQSDILGAAALGIQNFLLLTGDHQSFGNHPQAKGVYDIDSVQFLNIVRSMRDDRLFANGEFIKEPIPNLFLGAAINPFADPFDYRIHRLEKKIMAGVQFIQTQSVFNLEVFFSWMDMVRSVGLDKKVHILAGITPLKSVKMTERMKFHVPGVDVPDSIYERMRKAVNPKTEGYSIALELIRELRNCLGIDGVHITALFWEEIIPCLIKESGLYPRPIID